MKTDGWKNKHNVVLFLLCGIFLSFNLTMAIRYIYHNGLSFGDFYIRWQECAYLLRGMNPFDVMKGMVPPNNEIGSLLSGVGTLPWAYFIGNVIHPGFLPYNMAKGYGLFLYAALPLVTALILLRYIKKKYQVQDTFTLIMISLSVFFPYKWLSALSLGNQGGIVCCLIIISMCLLDEFPLLSGILLGISMVKPQISALFLFILLLNKKFKPIIAASAVVLVSWIASFVITRTAPFEMLSAMFTQGMGYLSFTYFGLFDFLKNFHVQADVILILDMAAGLIFTTAYFFVCHKKNCLNSLTLFSGAAIASTFWFYKSTPDLVILIIPGILLLLILVNSKVNRFSILVSLMVCALFYLNLVSSVLPRVLSFLFSSQQTGLYAVCALMEKALFMGLAFALLSYAAKTIFKEENGVVPRA